MTEPRFDREQLFDEDYLYFYADALADEQTDREVEVLWRLLELEPGMDVLDVACGHGRIANRLAERGCRVTGLDASPLFLELAQADAGRRGVAVEYVEGDMRRLPWRGRFDRAVNWFTSFGYFSDDVDRQVLREVCDALRPGGRLVLDVHNRDALMRVFQPDGAVERGDDIMVDRRSFDVVTGRLESDRIVVRGGRTRRMHFSVRLFTFTELRDWLRSAGFSSVGGYDKVSGEPLTPETRRMLVVATR